jgi:hypothetical protein
MNRPGKVMFLSALGLLLSSAPAAAYVRTVNGSGKPVRWTDSCISLVAHTNNAPAPLYAAGMMKALNGAAAMWGRPSYTCTPLTLSVTEEPKMPGIVARDKTNRVLILTDRWCRQSGESNAPCYSRATLAITTITAYTSGTISEADIEVNAVNFSWDDRAARPLAHGQDLQSALVHELGHLVGLDHNCIATTAPATGPSTTGATRSPTARAPPSR